MIQLAKMKLILSFLLLYQCLGKRWDPKENGVDKSFRNLQQQTPTCKKMELSMSRNDYFVGIWDGDGGLVFDTYIDGLKVDICYDPTQCYLFEMQSF